MDAVRKPRILFVDDESDVLDALRLSLRRDRRRWQLDFACGGEEALQKLAEQPVDLLVSDMRMPAMDGATLVTRVAEQYPSCMRFILSGEADADLVRRALPVVSQWLSKPCDQRVLKRAIERAFSVQRLLECPTLQAFVAEATIISSLPQVYRRIVAALQDPKLSLGDIADIITSDPGMAGKVLQLANSALVGGNVRVTSIDEALARLGLATVAQLALASELFRQLDELHCPPGFCEEFEHHARFVAQLAPALLPEDSEERAVASAAGVLQDVGQLVLLASDPTKFQRVRDGSSELAEFGVTHEEVGAAVLASWGLPLVLVEAVAHHHQTEPSEVDGIGVGLAVQVANLLATIGRDEQALEQGLHDLGLAEQAARVLAVAEQTESKLKEVD